jgi:hypothetical protein
MITSIAVPTVKSGGLWIKCGKTNSAVYVKAKSIGLEGNHTIKI